MKEKIKRFKSGKEQIFVLLFYGSLFIIMSYNFIDSAFQDETELLEHWGKQKLVGSGGQRSAQAIEMLVINEFGKTVFLLFTLLLDAFLFMGFLKTISTYRRFKKREREIREGLRAPDDYVDDYVRIPLWRKIVNLFTKKRKKKYPSERTMRDSLKKNKYYKE